MGTKKITYLLGAGASANALPVVNNLSERVQDLIYYIEGFKVNTSLSFDVFEPIIDELKWLLVESSNHQSIDTLAKKFYLNDPRSLNRLKIILILYFTIEQSFDIPPRAKSISENEENYLLRISKSPNLKLDKRYDNLVASLLRKENRELILNENIKILSWNYDMQLEIALMRYLGGNLDWIKETNAIFPNKFWKEQIEQGSIHLNRFLAIKLNGNAHISTYSNQEREDTLLDALLNDKSNSTNLQWFLNRVNNLINPMQVSSNQTVKQLITKNFQFAWENMDDRPDGYSDAMEQVKGISKQTEVLIIIGYSFPFFNSEIDKTILNNMKLVEVIIQDLDPQLIEDRVRELTKGNKDFSKTIKLLQPGSYFFIHSDT